jgi:hypothetical protein
MSAKNHNILFIVPGYGVPKNIFKDENYLKYLNYASNYLSQFTLRNPDVNIAIIFCGGKIDMYKPYKRTAASEMVKLFRKIIDKKFTKDALSQITILEEAKSFSTLDDLLYTKEVMSKKRIHPDKIFIFCESSREDRLRKLAEQIFGQPSTTLPIVLPAKGQKKDPRLLKQKEEVALRWSLKALKDSNYLKKYRTIYREKLDLLRKTPEADRPKALLQWWKKVVEQDKALQKK